MNALRHTLAVAALGVALALPLHAHADPCKLEITGNDQMQYDKKELDVAGELQDGHLTLHHAGKLPTAAMGHNWVLVNAPGPGRGGQCRHGRGPCQQLHRRGRQARAGAHQGRRRRRESTA